MRKRSITIILSVVFLLLFLLVPSGCTNNGSDSGDDQDAADDQGEKIIKIGVFEPLSGINSESGMKETLGIKYANSIVNSIEIDGESYEIQLVFSDNESSAERVPDGAKSLVDAGVSAAIGSYGSAESISASDIFQEAGIPVVGASCTDPAVTKGNKHYFRICFTDDFQAEAMARYGTKELGSTFAFCLDGGDEQSKNLAKSIREEFEKLGGVVPYAEITEGENAYKDAVSSIGASGADLLFTTISPQAAKGLITQMEQEGLNMPVISSVAWEHDEVAADAKDKSIDLYITSYYDEESLSEDGKKIIGEYQEWLNADPGRLSENGGDDTVSVLSMLGYDAYMTVIEAVGVAQSADSEAINDALWKVKYSGVTGIIEFEPENGDDVHDVLHIKTADRQTGKWKLAKILLPDK